MENQWPTRTAKNSPLECFALDYSPYVPKCRACPHAPECVKHMGSRLHKISLSRAEFRLVPQALWDYAYQTVDKYTDPEIPVIEQTYIICFTTVFDGHPKDRIGQHASFICARAKELNCSVRLYMLTNMLAWQSVQEEKERIQPDAPSATFSAKVLVGKLAMERAKAYAEVCRREFGTFSVSSIDTQTGSELEKNSLEQVLLRNEIAVGRFVIGWKLENAGPVFEQLYSALELSLDPRWLATEPSYRPIIEQHLAKPKGTSVLRDQRFSVTQVVRHMKKDRQYCIATFRTRELIMPRAVAEVLRYFGYKADDFDVDDKPIIEPLKMWVHLARAISQYNCWLHITGDDSIYGKTKLTRRKRL
jgi:hypothetical protein